MSIFICDYFNIIILYMFWIAGKPYNIRVCAAYNTFILFVLLPYNAIIKVIFCAGFCRLVFGCLVYLYNNIATSCAII